MLWSISTVCCRLLCICSGYFLFFAQLSLCRTYSCPCVHSFIFRQMSSCFILHVEPDCFDILRNEMKKKKQLNDIVSDVCSYIDVLVFIVKIGISMEIFFRCLQMMKYHSTLVWNYFPSSSMLCKQYKMIFPAESKWCVIAFNHLLGHIHISSRKKNLSNNLKLG